MFAVFRTGGKQYKVAKNDVLEIERLPGDSGAILEFTEVLMVGDAGKTVVGQPLVAGASVAAALVDQVLADKVLIFKKKRRHNYRRKRGHRQPLSLIRVMDILTDGRKADHAALAAEIEKSKPQSKPQPKPEGAPKAAKPKKPAKKAAAPAGKKAKSTKPAKKAGGKDKAKKK
jgi:large subunit ribosomal protein L21